MLGFERDCALQLQKEPAHESPKIKKISKNGIKEG